MVYGEQLGANEYPVALASVVMASKQILAG